MIFKSTHSVRAFISVLMSTLVLGGCDGAKGSGASNEPRATPPASQPTSKPAAGHDAAPSGNKADGAKTTTATETDGVKHPSSDHAAPASTPTDTNPAASGKPSKVSGVAEVLELINPNEAYQSIEAAAPPNKFTLTTRNIKRMRLSRDHIGGMRQDRSISLLIDGQGIEWLPRSRVIELRRTTTGAWEVVK